MDIAYQKVREALNARIAEASRRASPPRRSTPSRRRPSGSRASTPTRMDAAAREERASSGKVGAFEGAGYTSKGLYRPSLDCIMFSKGTKPFCPVCRRAIDRVIDYYGE